MAAVILAIVTGCSPTLEPLSLHVEGTNPEAGGLHPANQPIRIRMTSYLAMSTINPSAIELSSGSLKATFSTGYDPIDKTLLIQPNLNLRLGVAYQVTVHQDAVLALDGARLTQPITLTFTTAPPAEEDAPNGPLSFEDDIEPIIERRCGCHGEPQGPYPVLEVESLINQKSQRQPGRLLVVPGRPLESYLIQTILPDYPGVFGDNKVLDDRERRTLLRWVSYL